MSISKFDDIRDVLIKHDIEIVSVIENDLICGICRKVAIDPFATICGCTHCKICIQKYTANGSYYCPGSKLECRECFLDRNTDIYFDPRSLFRISKLIAKCPNSSCEVEIPLSEMKQHIASCEKRNVFCPYFTVGCNDSKIILASVDEHIRENTVSHAYMMMEHVNNTKNVVDELMKDYEERLQNQEKLIEDLRLKINESSNIVISQHENETFNNGIWLMFKRLDRKLQLPNVLLVVLLMVAIQIIMSIQRVNQEQLAEQMNQLQSLTEDLSNHEYGNYLWRISNFSDVVESLSSKKKEMIESRPFFSHKYGYKIKLQITTSKVEFNLASYMYVKLVIIPGPYDDVVKWPFDQRVNVVFLNLDSGEDFQSWYSHANGVRKPPLLRPTKNKNESGAEFYFDRVKLVNTRGFVKDDTVYVMFLMK